MFDHTKLYWKQYTMILFPTLAICRLKNCI